jgi:regulator of protease activity HflC (stomatin/prohibitin superfamily)
VKIQDIELPDDMRRIMAKQAEAERERRSVIIQAEGEFAAATKLAEAARVLSAVPGGMQMRTLQAIEEVGANNGKTTIFALPIEFGAAAAAFAEHFKK